MRNLHVRDLRRRLLLGGVAPKHVNRTIKELRHHFADLERKALAEGLSAREAVARASEQLGDHELIIEEALARPELKSWAYRYPWGIYGLLPLGLFVLVVVGSVALIFDLLEFAQSASGLTPAAFANDLAGRWWARALLEGWRVSMVYALPVLLAGGLCFFAARRGTPVLWPAVGVFLVLFLGASADVHVVHPTSPDELGELGAGIVWGTQFFQPVRVLRLLIPLILVLGPYCWWRRTQQAAPT